MRFSAALRCPPRGMGRVKTPRFAPAPARDALIYEFHENSGGKHFSNPLIFGIMYAVKIGPCTAVRAFRRAVRLYCTARPAEAGGAQGNRRAHGPVPDLRETAAYTALYGNREGGTVRCGL